MANLPQELPWFKLLGYLVLAAACGVVLALVPTGIILYALFASGGYTREALVELSAETLWFIGAIGALIAVPVFIFAGQAVMPRCLRDVTLGSLTGVGIILLSTLIIDHALLGPSSKRQAPPTEAALFYGVPIGLVVGGLCGALIGKRSRHAIGTGTSGQLKS